MRRRGTAVALCLLGAGGAHAAEATHSGKLGIGGSQTTGGVTGVNVVYWPGPFALDFTAGLDLTFPSDGNGAVRFVLAAGAFYPLLASTGADFSIGGRFDFGVGKVTYGPGTSPEAGLQIDFEIPARLEWWVTDHFSLHAELGLAIEIVTNTTRVFAAAGGNAQADGFGIVLPGTRVVGTGGFTFYF
ncbi:MAG TPA: hypothetical protein VKE22_29095 [Haliangiales bacterium]|nr:hypothetical protein [Haliangiales bacterium]